MAVRGRSRQVQSSSRLSGGRQRSSLARQTTHRCDRVRSEVAAFAVGWSAICAVSLSAPCAVVSTAGSGLLLVEEPSSLRDTKFGSRITANAAAVTSARPRMSCCQASGTLSDARRAAGASDNIEQARRAAAGGTRVGQAGDEPGPLPLLPARDAVSSSLNALMLQHTHPASKIFWPARSAHSITIASAASSSARSVRGEPRAVCAPRPHAHGPTWPIRPPTGRTIGHTTSPCSNVTRLRTTPPLPRRGASRPGRSPRVHAGRQ